jgi:O-glycosyl hydrolase
MALRLLGHSQAGVDTTHVEDQVVEAGAGHQAALAVVVGLVGQRHQQLLGFVAAALQAGQLRHQQGGVEASTGLDGGHRQAFGKRKVVPPAGQAGRLVHQLRVAGPAR